ncbi:MAG: HNH endonuclease [Flavobacterium sp.]
MENFKQSDYLPSGYLINVEGEILSPSKKILKQTISNSGYKFINIKNKGYFTHRALAFAFIKKIEGKDIVNHKDGNKLNNNLNNLEWCTRSENIKHMYDNGLKQYRPMHYKNKFGAEHNRSKKVLCVTDGKSFGSMSEAERFYNFGGGAVSWSIKNEKPIYGKHFEIGG